MADNEVSIVVTVKDQTSGALKGIGGNLQGLGKVALGVAAGGIAALGTGLVVAASKAIPAASNLNEALNATSVVFGDAAGIVQDFGKTAADVAGLSASEFNQMAAQSGAMLQNYGLNADEAAGATINLATRAADMASIFNTDVSDAMTAINAAMRGEADPIERYGVSMNMVSVEAKAMAMGFEKVDGAFSATALTQARLALLMEQTDKISGDFVNTSGDLANATRVNQARWENFMAQVGEVGLPIMTMFQGVLMDIGEKVFPIVTEALENIMPIVEGIAEAFGTFMGNLLAGVSPLDAVKSLIWDLGTALGLNKEQIGGLVTGFQGLVDTVQNIIATISPYIQMAWDWISQNVELKDVLIGLGIAIAAIVIPAIISIVSAIAPIILTFVAVTAVVALLRTAWENNWGGIQEKTQAVIAFVSNLISTALAAIQGWWSENGDQVIATVTNLWNTVKDAFNTAVTVISDVISTTLTAIQGWWAENGDQVIATVQSLWETVKAAFNAAVTFISDLVSGVLNAISGFWEEHGATITATAQALWDGIIAIVDWFVGQFSLIFEAFSLAFQGDWHGFGEKLREVWDNAWILIKDVVSKAWDWFVEVVPQIVDSVVKFFTETDWGAVGTSIVQGIADGIRAGIAWVTDAAKAVAKAALDAAKGFLGIESPSRLFYDIGQAIGEGLALGIRDSTDDVMDAMLDVAGKLGSIGGGFANLFKAKRIDPLEEFLKGTEKAVPEMAEALLASLDSLHGTTGITLEDLLDPVKSAQLSMRYMSILPAGMRQDWAEMLNLMAERNRKQEEFTEQNARLLELEKQQQNLAFLQQQLNLLDLIQEHGLDVEDILGGIQLGLGADEGGLMDAMAKAMQALIAQAEQELGISSPSKAFLEIGRNLMSGMAQGINQGAQMVAGASRGAAQNVTNYFNLTMNTNAAQERVVEDFNMMRAMAGA